jgi:hypothetical protein
MDPDRLIPEGQIAFALLAPVVNVAMAAGTGGNFADIGRRYVNPLFAIDDV